MKNIKTIFTYMVVGALVMALSISCKSNEEPQATGETSSNHPSQGSYTNELDGTGATVTINNDACTIEGTAFLYGSPKEYTNFSITVTSGGISILILTFITLVVTTNNLKRPFIRLL
ncbi:hypothetical protein [Brachyspira catarrhinii]|uniref:Uncharacterized protein n=1 Tax=Brachyspira catarrhinii TaxID=2528966 RepID=A0ABY2TPX8_9SPIR|nr:hypothetical protein [Brachyspira catarrhinii]TKZ23234.1 hypothetical protein EZH24_13075 [Brachyspira catarrhinii]